MNSLIKQVEKILADSMIKKPIVKRIRVIQKMVADAFEITVEDMRSAKRGAAYVYPRHLAMYICRELAKASYPLIGREFMRDHSTVIFAYRKIKKQLTTKKEMDSNLVKLRG